MKKLIFKTVSLILVFTYIFNLCLHDLSFAGQSGTPKKSISKVTKEELIGYKKSDVSLKQGEGVRVLSGGSQDSFAPEKAIKSFYLDPFSGTLNLSLPIFTPPGRKGVQPSLNLTYSSRNANGPFGWGWRMDFGGYIERSTKNGIPKYDSTDTFICFLNGTNYELISIGGGEYRSKNESDFLKFIFNGTSWKIKDKQGNTYYFGRNYVSRDYVDKFNPDITKIFRWYLDGIKDPNGNALFSFIWPKGYTSSIKPVPKKITYTKYEPNTDVYNEENGPMIIYFVTESLLGEDRKDVFISFRHGSDDFTGEGWGRIKEIFVCPAESPYDNPNTSFFKKYVFEYKYSQITNRSLLTKITEIGSDGTAMPPVTFTYQETTQPTYQILSIVADPTVGDNLWNIRVDDTGDIPNHISWWVDTNYELDPHWSIYDWGPIFTQASGSDIGLNWNIGQNGDLSINNTSPWRSFYAWTYIYVRNERNLNISCSGDAHHTIYLNADYSNSYRGTSLSLPLKAGYNLIEVTGYNKNNFSFNLSANIVGNVDLMNSQQVTVPSLSGDFNGDGVDDIGTFFASTGTCKISISNGSAFLPKQTWIDNFGVNQRLLLGDFNGDGKTDICAFDSTNGNWRIALSDGTKFVDNGVWISNFGVNSKPFTGEFNGDGKTDIGIFFNLDEWLWDCQIAINAGNTFEKGRSFSAGSKDEINLWGDFNADGLTDSVVFNDYWHNGFWDIAFNYGHAADGYWVGVGNCYTENFGVGIKNPLALDFTGDGLTDIGYYDYAAGNFKIRTFNGVGEMFSETKKLPFDFSLRDENIQIQTGDYNGDGIQDFCAYTPLGGNIEIALSNGDIPDLLSKLENGTGGTLELKYLAYSKFNDAGGNLPFILPVLSKSVVSDGQGNSYKTTYAYSGGLYDTEDKEFRGFAYARVIDAEGNTTESYFKQDDIYKGKLYKQEIKDKDGRLFSKVENTWQHTEPYPGVYFPYLAQTDNYIYDGDATYKHTWTKFEYDFYGNITKVISEGDAEVTGDEKTQITEYTYNATDWLVAFPKHAYLLDQNQNKISEKWLYYDNHTNIDDPPIKGLLTKEELWLYNPLTQTETRLPTTYVYDEYGNLTSVTDPLGRTTTTIYDSELHTYPVTTTNALGHTIKTTYDPKLGVLLESIDPNNQKTTKVYDPLGRLIKIIGPMDSADYPPSVIYEYDLTSRPIKTTKKVKVDYTSTPEYLTYYSFYDGLSRLIQTKSPAENNPQTNTPRQVVSNIVTFDQRGQVKEKYLPYFVDASADYVAPTYDTPHTTFSYDPLGRLIQTTNPDLTYSTTNYSDWVTTTTDENGHYKTQYFDAYGKIVKIEEHNGSQTYTTTYEYDALGNLVKLTDNQNNITQIWYDSLGRKVKMDDPDMGVWTYEYDKVGNLTKQTDAKGQILTFTYDNLNRLKEKKGFIPGQGTVPITLATYTYDTGTNSIGRLSKITDLSGSIQFYYDNLGREIKSTKTIAGSGAYTVERTYDALDRLVTLKYPDGEIVTYIYNPQGIETVMRNYITNIDYSPTGQITKIIYGNGTETNYAYDPNTLRLTNLTTQSPQGKIQDLNYQFDNVGNIKNITDYVNTATQSFLYDDLNRLIQAQGSYGSLTYAYDSIGNMTRKEGVNLTYGKSGRLPHAVTKYGSTLIDYDANGNMIKKGNLELTYDAENRLTQTQDKFSTATVTLTLTPGWNFISFPVIPADSKISSVLSSIAGKHAQVSRYNSTTKQFEHYVGNSKYDQFSSFEYARGYQIYITGSDTLTLKVTGTIPQTPQSTSLKTGYNLIFSPRTYSTPVEETLKSLNLGVDYSKVLYYNKAQNKFLEYSSAKKEFNYLSAGIAYYILALKDTIWNITYKPPTTSFSYDGDGGRVKKTLPSGTTTTYIGSLFEIDSSGKANKYIFAGPKRVCTVESTGAKSYYHSDHLGSSNLTTDKDGKQLSLLEYRPYGTLSKATGTSYPKHRFTGKELDYSTGLYFYGARYYDPALGRFITADTIIQAPFDPQSLNRYSYCRNNPLIYTDPTGHSFWGAVGGFFSAVGSFIGGIFSAIGGFFSGFFGGAFGRGGGGGSSGGSSGGGGASLPASSRAGSGPSSSEVSQSFISGAWNFGSSIGSAIGGMFKAGTMNIGGGIRDWLSESRAGWYSVGGGRVNPEDVPPDSIIFTGGVRTSFEASLAQAAKAGAQYLFYNPSSTFLADFVESFLQKFTFTSSIDRQMAAGLSQGQENIKLIGRSQGALTVSNALINLGLRGEDSVGQARYKNYPISQLRGTISAWMSGAHAEYGTNTFDPANVAGPNLNLIKFIGGIVGGFLFGAKYHNDD